MLLPEYVELGTAAYDEHQHTFWRNHPMEGAELVAKVLRMPDVAEAIRSHHERIDGKGYPLGLTGADIPLSARIVSVSEAWVALTSERGYRPALPVENALVVLQAGAGSQWDADLVDAVAQVVGPHAAQIPPHNQNLTAGAGTIVRPDSAARIRARQGSHVRLRV